MDDDFDSAVQKQLDAAMPWVGLYITAASAICSLATAVDAVNSFRQKKLWFPCKFSSLNAAYLTLLAVVMKLPMDLNTVMIESEMDLSAKLSSVHFMSTTITNFMPSLGSMSDNEVLANVVGLVILVTTITGNVGIQFIELHRFLKPGKVKVANRIPSWLTVVSLMLVSILMFVSLAVTASTMKRNLNWMYEEKHKVMLTEEEELEGDDQRRYMMKYWVMAQSCSTQFVMARSVVCTSAAVICWISYITLSISNLIDGKTLKGPAKSTYGIYTKWIVYLQSIGLNIGVFVAMLRWFRIVMFRCSTTHSNTFKKEFKIEAYWIQTLNDWRKSSAGMQIRPNRFMKHLYDVKWCVLTLCIKIQIFIVLASKLLVLFSVLTLRPFLSCFSHMYEKVMQTEHALYADGDSGMYLNLKRYVLLLEGEAELPPSFVKSMCDEADLMIQKGRERQPSSLVSLLRKSYNLNGVGKLYSSQIPCLLPQEPQDCWTLPVVTLTCIAVALPNTALQIRKQLLRSVGEGLSLATIVEETLDKSVQLKIVKDVARVTWIKVLFYSKWLDIDFHRSFVNCKSSKEVLQELSDKAEEIVMEFKREVQDPIMENPVNLPVKVVAANSMYRICRTILGVDENKKNCEDMFERISVMIADILAACLTNLPCAITKMCYQNPIEKRERSVQEAFLLLGKTEQVIEVVRKQERPSLDRDKAAYIEEWRAFFQQHKDDEGASTLTSSDRHGSEE